MALLYVLRFVVAARSTAKGARLALLSATPLPGSVGEPLAIEPPGDDDSAPANLSASKNQGHAIRQSRWGTKTARFLAAVEEQYGELSGIGLDKVGRICSELAPLVELNVGVRALGAQVGDPRRPAGGE